LAPACLPEKRTLSPELDRPTAQATSRSPGTFLTIPLASIRRDPAAQLREAIDEGVVAEYAAAIRISVPAAMKMNSDARMGYST
jgi:hypothetical protein